jgi:hypothetical protein
MEINLDDNFALVSEEYNFMLMKRGTIREGSKNAGEERRTVIGYYSRLEHVLDAYAQKALKGLPVGDLAALMSEVRKLDESVQRAGAAFLERFPPNYARAPNKAPAV